MKIVMKLQVKLLVALLFISVTSFSQVKKDSVEHVYNSPFKEGYIVYKAKGSADHSIPFVNIYSKANDVFALAEGKVERIFRLVDEDLIMVRKGDTTFQYSNIDSAVVKVGDNIQKGDLIGKAMKNTENNRYELVFGVAVGTKRMIYTDYAGFLRKYNQ